MNFTKSELCKLVRYCDVKRNEDERNMRRIRRNIDSMTERFNQIPKDLVEQDGLLSPQDELDLLSASKAEAVILKKKLKLEISKLK